MEKYEQGEHWRKRKRALDGIEDPVLAKCSIRK
jgi:hypothetical protein